MDMLSLREKHDYEAEIAELKLRLITMSAKHSDAKSKLAMFKAKYQSLITTRSSIAMALIVKRFNGEKIRLQEIANKSNLTYNMVADLSTKFNKGNIVN